MKKLLTFALAAIMAFSLFLTGCAGSGDKKQEAGKDGGTANKEKLKVVCLLNGNLGDKSFFDSANNGMNLIKEKLGYEVKTIEMGYDKTKWKPTLQDVSDQDYDVIVVGTWEMKENLEEVAPQYKDKKYIIFDTSVDYSKGDLSNVYSIEYKQNEGSFIAGALASKVTTSKMPFANPEKKIGFLGGMDTPIINDFLVGYIQGAKYIDKDVKVAISYIGDFENSAKGKEMALAQYNQGVDIGFNVAGQAGLGQLDAAKDSKKYAIGVDSDQAMLFKDKDAAKAELIPTSLLKRVDNSLLRALELMKDNKLEYGKKEVLGLKEKAMEVVENEFYNKLISEDLRKEMKTIEDKIVKGEIKVDTAYGMKTDDLNKLRNSVK
ncbi:BMP family ABC transporter substrate-binding protein [Hathewaya histolytica]|uniref:Basic membrane lipoprotein n=1 Tax=Hathewaya histolytica TaxID=1498 RepID=A0A4U9QW56_HATHI|nr:BMP family ABC transporter substrate-binding protein [Hathewaya histolytica]VTQ82875.1 basic membrane lipoprotein [Hathewaya histolytica]